MFFFLFKIHTHHKASGLGFRDNAALLQVKISDAARHRQTAVHVGLTDAVPCYETSTLAYSGTKPTRTHRTHHTHH